MNSPVKKSPKPRTPLKPRHVVLESPCDAVESVANPNEPKTGPQSPKSGSSRNWVPWSPSEMVEFYHFFKAHGPRFQEMSTVIPSKTKSQIRYYFYRILKKANEQLRSRGIILNMSIPADVLRVVEFYYQNHDFKIGRKRSTSKSEPSIPPRSRSSKQQIPPTTHQAEPQAGYITANQTHQYLDEHSDSFGNKALVQTDTQFDPIASNCDFLPPDDRVFQGSTGIVYSSTDHEHYSSPLTDLFSDDFFPSSDCFPSSATDALWSPSSSSCHSSNESPVTSLSETLAANPELLAASSGSYFDTEPIDAPFPTLNTSVDLPECHVDEPPSSIGHATQYQSFSTSQLELNPTSYRAASDLHQSVGVHDAADSLLCTGNHQQSFIPDVVSLQLVPLCDPVAMLMKSFGYAPKLHQEGNEKTCSEFDHLPLYRINLKKTKKVNFVLKHLRSKWAGIFQNLQASDLPLDGQTHESATLKLCYILNGELYSLFDEQTIEAVAMYLGASSSVLLYYVWDITEDQVLALQQFQTHTASSINDNPAQEQPVIAHAAEQIQDANPAPTSGEAPFVEDNQHAHDIQLHAPFNWEPHNLFPIE